MIKVKKNISCSLLQHIEIPLSEYSAGEVSNVGGTLVKFTLEAIVEHYGQLINAGHYFSFIKDGETWARVDDEFITESLRLTEKPYILIYRKI